MPPNSLDGTHVPIPWCQCYIGPNFPTFRTLLSHGLCTGSDDSAEDEDRQIPVLGQAPNQLGNLSICVSVCIVARCLHTLLRALSLGPSCWQDCFFWSAHTLDTDVCVTNIHVYIHRCISIFICTSIKYVYRSPMLWVLPTSPNLTPRRLLELLRLIPGLLPGLRRGVKTCH